MAPKDVHILLPGTCEYITLQGKKNCVAVIQLRVFVCLFVCLFFNSLCSSFMCNSKPQQPETQQKSVHRTYKART